MIYLDYNATAPVRPEVAQKMMELLAQPHNASSVHALGRAAKKHIEDARRIIADALSVWPREVIFTASGTEANNLALRSQPGRRVLASAVEHSSVLKAAPEVELIPVDAQGLVQLDALDALLAQSPRPALVSVMLANNETGVIQPLREISAITRQHQALLHCDAIQAVGRLAVDFGTLGVDMLTLSSHKSGGPQGAAALVVRGDLAIHPMLAGGGQELGRRAGTENVAAIAGFGVAMEQAQDLAQMAHMRRWLDRFEAEIKKTCPDAMVMGQGAERLGNTSCVSMPGVSNEVQLMIFDLAGYAVSAGSACSSGRVTASHVLAAMGVGEAHGASAIRVSAGWQTTEKDIRDFTAEWQKACNRLRKPQATGTHG